MKDTCIERPDFHILDVHYTNQPANERSGNALVRREFIPQISGIFASAAWCVSPTDWEPFIEKKRLELKDVKEKGYERLAEEALNKRLSQLRNDALLDKIDLLHQICKPPAGFSPMRHYKFDPERLKKQDDLRHDIVHGTALGTKLPNTEDDVQYLLKTAWYLMGLVNQRYGVKINPAEFGPAQPQPAPHHQSQNAI